MPSNGKEQLTAFSAAHKLAITAVSEGGMVCGDYYPLVQSKSFSATEWWSPVKAIQLAQKREGYQSLGIEAADSSSSGIHSSFFARNTNMGWDFFPLVYHTLHMDKLPKQVHVLGSE